MEWRSYYSPIMTKTGIGWDAKHEAVLGRPDSHSVDLLTMNVGGPSVDRASRIIEYLESRNVHVMVLTETEYDMLGMRLDVNETYELEIRNGSLSFKKYTEGT